MSSPGTTPDAADPTHRTELSPAQRHRELSEFVSLISHELRNPLTSIRGYAQLLQRQARNEAFAALRPHLAVIVQEVDRLASHTELLLDVARMETNRIALQRGPVDMALVAHEVQLAMAQAGPAPVTRSGDPGPAVLVDADPKRVRQIIRTMFEFAVQRSPDGADPEVSLVTEDHTGILELRVPGFTLTPAETERLLDRLVHISDDGRERSLAQVPLVIAAGLASAHGGSLEVRSGPGASTRIWLRLPLVEGRGS